MIRNVHSRDFACDPALLGDLLSRLGSPSDSLWPRDAWPPMVLDRPLGVGAAGGHGPIRYSVTDYVPGQRVEFRFDPSMFVSGTHTLEVVPGQAALRHTLVGRPRGVRGLLLWSLAVRWLHDACLEDLLDRAGVAAGSPRAVPARWSPYVRLLRGLSDRRRRPSAPALLDAAMPAYDVQEWHSRWIDAPPAAVWAALAALTLDDLRLTRPLVALRRLPRSRRGAAGPLLSADGPLRLLSADAPRYALAGGVSRAFERRPTRRPVATLDEFAAVTEPGWVTHLADFSIVPRRGGAQVTTRTRVRSTDPATRRRFALYWAVIRPWSGLIRRDLLAALARTARADTGLRAVPAERAD